jgi:hypothetical protein
MYFLQWGEVEAVIALGEGESGAEFSLNFKNE